MRAITPIREGFVDRDGVKVAYEVFGNDNRTVLLAPSWAIVPSSLVWKAQAPYLARHFRVVMIDPRGHGRSDRPADPAAYTADCYAEDLIAVLDDVGAADAVVMGVCRGAWWSFLAARRHPDRIRGIAAISPDAPFLAEPAPDRVDFDAVLSEKDGWARFNRHYWRRDFAGFAEFYWDALFPEPHSTKVREDAVRSTMQTRTETLAATIDASWSVADTAEAEAVLRAVSCPVLVIRGTDARVASDPMLDRITELTCAETAVVEGGPLPHARTPVPVNHMLYEFAMRVAPEPRQAVRWCRPLDRPRRVLFVPSAIGLGHAERDVAIAAELRALRPGLKVQWLAQNPVTEVLARRGESIHPASSFLASECAHIESEAGDEHDLHAFQAVRRMDEIMVANFMLFAEVTADERYDLVVGDEAWEVDYFLHDCPEIKRAPYAFLTDFVGLLPMPDGGAAEAALTADYNAEMVEQVTRLPRQRDRAIFIGNPSDLVTAPMGAGLPTVREWAMQRFTFGGYVTDFPAWADRGQVRAELGWPQDATVCLVTVGGSGVGSALIRRALAAYPIARAALPSLRMVVVAGPRIDPAQFAVGDGVEVHRYVDRLHKMMAACDVAIVQGGLTTTMTLTAYQRPFVYVPLRGHFEQNFHVRHRLDNYRAGRRLEFGETGPEQLAAALLAECGRVVDYAPVESDGAARVAAMLADFL